MNATLLREWALLHFENLIEEESPEFITNTLFILLQDYEIDIDKIDHITTNSLINLQIPFKHFGFLTTVIDASKSKNILQNYLSSSF